MSDDERRQADLDAILTTYDRYADDGRAALWDTSNRGYARLARDRDRALVDLVRASADVGARLLDVGCGTGALAVLLADARPDIDVCGVDLIPERIEIARQRAPGATFRVGSADRLADDDGSYDIAAALTLFSSLPSDALERSIAAEIARVVRPGGWLIWYDLRRPNPWNAAVHAVRAPRLRELFPGWRLDVRSCSVLPPLARRLGRTTPLLYPLLDAIPLAHSHLIGRARKPG